MNKFNTILCFFNLLILGNSYAGQIIQNEEIHPIYVENCSSSEGFTICYPQRKENIAELIELHNSCEQKKEVDDSVIGDCLMAKRLAEVEKECAETFKSGHPMSDVCIEETFKESKIPAIDKGIVKCEKKYQEYIRTHLSEEFPKLTVSFVTGVSRPDFIHKVKSPNILGAGDVLLLPEHSNSAFCDEDFNISMTQMKEQIQEAKNIMRKFYRYELNSHGESTERLDEFKKAVKILDDPQGHLAIFSITCPNGVDGEEKVEVIGYHKEVVTKKPVKEQSRTTQQPTKNFGLTRQQIIDKCLPKEMKEILAYDKKMSETDKAPIGPIMGFGELGTGPKQIPYRSMGPSGIFEEKIINSCLKGKGLFEHKNDGVYHNGKRIDFSAFLSNPYSVEEQNIYNEIVEEILSEINDPEIGKLEFEQIIGDHYMLEGMRKSREQADKIAEEGNYWSWCFAEMEYIEVSEGYLLDEKCEEISVEDFLAEQKANGNSLWQPNLNDDDFRNDDAEIEDSGYEDTGYEDTGYEDTGY